MLSIQIDGASRGNPGPSGIGIIIKDNNKIIEKYGEFIGNKTSVESELLALRKAFQLAIKYKEKQNEDKIVLVDKIQRKTKEDHDELTVLSDCHFIIHNRINKQKIRRRELSQLNREIKNLESKFRIINYRLIPRERNIPVDLLAKRAINKKVIYKL